MKNKIWLISAALGLFFLLTACQVHPPAAPGKPVSRFKVTALVCGNAQAGQANCFARLCSDLDSCPQLSAMSDRAAFNFVKTVSECVDCSTPNFPPERGIGKCVEYHISKSLLKTEVTLWASDACSFRYGAPAESRLNIELYPVTLRIDRIEPAVEYISVPGEEK